MLFSGVRQSSEIVPEGRDEDKNQDGQHQESRREGWTDAAIMLCKLNKSL